MTPEAARELLHLDRVHVAQFRLPPRAQRVEGNGLAGADRRGGVNQGGVAQRRVEFGVRGLGEEGRVECGGGGREADRR